MNRFYVKCPDCGHPITAEHYNQEATFVSCVTCNSLLNIRAFPALYRGSGSQAYATQAAFDDAACFFHADKKAEQLCDDCGRFLCNVCALPMGDETICSSCLENRRKDEKGRKQYTARQMRYDILALQLAVLPLLFFYFTIFTAPATLFIVVRFWKKDMVLARGRKLRFSLAFIVALLQVAGWIYLAVVLVRKIAHG